MTEKQQFDDMLDFCPRCFASSENGSWGHVTHSDMCENCGVVGASIRIPRYAVGFIREQASWVGKRHYPHKEDLDTARELQFLRSIAPDHDIVVEERKHLDPDNRGRYVTSYAVRRGRISIGPFDSPEEARSHGKIKLPYLVPEGFMKEDHE